MIAEIVGSTGWAYAPMFYEPEYHADGTIAAMNRTRSDVPREVMACTINQDFDAIALPTKPIVPFVETTHDRIAIEIMRGCPWQCRFCQSTVIKRPLRVRSVEMIVQSALESYRNTGHHEISLLSLSTSDYPYFEELVNRMHEVFNPLGVNISLPSLRINHQLRSLPSLMKGARKSGLTLAPEVARDDMREQIRKKIKNDDLYEGCREAFKHGWQRVKLYFMCGLPGERAVDLDGIVDMAEHISTIGKEVRGRYADVTASVSNFVPKPHTPYQWNGMQTREYLQWAGQYLRRRCRLRAVRIKQHDIECSLLEGVLNARRPPHRSRPGRSVASRLPTGWLARVLQAGDLVANLRRPGHRRRLVFPANAADGRGAALGPRQREEGARILRKGTNPESRATGSDGQRDMNKTAQLLTADDLLKRAGRRPRHRARLSLSRGRDLRLNPE